MPKEIGPKEITNYNSIVDYQLLQKLKLSKEKELEYLNYRINQMQNKKWVYNILLN